MIEVLNTADGSAWIEDEIRYGLRGAWGEDAWSNVVIVEATMVMETDKKGPLIDVKVLAFRGDRYASMAHVFIHQSTLNRDTFRKCGVDLAGALRKSLDTQLPPLEARTEEPQATGPEETSGGHQAGR